MPRMAVQGIHGAERPDGRVVWTETSQGMSSDFNDTSFLTTACTAQFFSRYFTCALIRVLPMTLLCACAHVCMVGALHFGTSRGLRATAFGHTLLGAIFICTSTPPTLMSFRELLMYVYTLPVNDLPLIVLWTYKFSVHAITPPVLAKMLKCRVSSRTRANTGAISTQVAQNVTTPWPLEILDHNGKLHEVCLKLIKAARVRLVYWSLDFAD